MNYKKAFTALAFVLFIFKNGNGQANVETLLYNTTNNTYNGALTDVVSVSYDNTYLYIESSGIPSYFVNYAGVSVFQPANQNFVFRIKRSPKQETNTNTSGFFGAIGVGINGSPFFNLRDGKSWDDSTNSFSFAGSDIWHSVAYEFEGLDMDGSYGHSTASNVYHHHVADIELFDENDAANHSPIVGWAFDGYPIYGSYGYLDPTDASSGISRMTPSYQTRNITDRTVLPDGTVLTNPSDWGPPINSTYPLGSCEEDFEFVAGLGTLDQHNGRWCITPEYPCGTYAYFVTIDASLEPIFPFIIGLTYYGELDFNNSSQFTNATIPGTVQNHTIGVDICGNTITQTITQPTCGELNGSITLSTIDFGENPCFNWSTGETEATRNNLGSGMYTVTVTGNSCENIFNIELTDNSLPIDTSVSQTDNVLTANNNSASGYQWIDCDTMLPVDGETNQSFTAMVNGNYSVEITENGCTDTSNCVFLNTLSNTETYIKSLISLHPNPIDTELQLNIDPSVNTYHFSIYDLSGKTLLYKQNNHGKIKISLDSLMKSGLYICEITINSRSFHYKLLKK